MSQTSHKWLVSILFESKICQQVFFYNFWPLPLKFGDVINERPLSFFFLVDSSLCHVVCLSIYDPVFQRCALNGLVHTGSFVCNTGKFRLKEWKKTRKSQFNSSNWKKIDLFFFLCISIKYVLFSLKGILSSDALSTLT